MSNESGPEAAQMKQSVEEEYDQNEETLREDDHEMPGKPSEREIISIDSGGSSGEEETTRKKNYTPFTVGGEIDEKAYCLLDGIYQEPDDDDIDNATRVTLPIAVLPAVLGRTHKTDDKNFVGVGKAKALSRQQCRIEYRTDPGSTAHLVTESLQLNNNTMLVYEPGEPMQTDLILPDDSDKKPPSSGFFVITCLGKNRIMVNGRRVEPGETAWIPSGSTIRMNNFKLYFFTPLDESKETIQVPINAPKTTTDPSRKRKMQVSTAVPTAVKSKPFNLQGKRSKTLQAEIDALSTDELLQRLREAEEENVWERRQQIIGTTLAFHAVLEAANDPIIQQANEELSRGEIMNWIRDSERFGGFVKFILTKMEAKSYQASVTKALLKAGYTRTTASGRYVKWRLPDRVEKGKGESEGSARNQELKQTKREGTLKAVEKKVIAKETEEADDYDQSNQSENDPISDDEKGFLHNDDDGDEIAKEVDRHGYDDEVSDGSGPEAEEEGISGEDSML